MSDTTLNNEEQDLQRLRDILFGEQALQTEDRFENLEKGINALRRETRQLRNAIEMEAIARIKIDGEHKALLQKERQMALTDLSTIFLNYLENEKAKRSYQYQELQKTLEAGRQAQAQMTEQMIAMLHEEQRQRDEQLTRLQKNLLSGQQSEDEVVDGLSNMLHNYRELHHHQQLPTLAPVPPTPILPSSTEGTPENSG